MGHHAPIKTTWYRDYFNIKTLPVWAVHVAAVALVVVLGWSWSGFGIALALYYARMFFVTGAYHRYFSHRTYKTSRWFQFVLALFGGMCAQKGTLWWAEHHRLHHQYSDTEQDPHSMKLHGFMWSHMGWIFSHQYRVDHETNHVPDLAKFPELRWLDRHHWTPVVLYAAVLYALGEYGSARGGLFMLTWGFAVSTVMLWHGTFCINSISHWMGRKRFDTGDESKNSLVLALVTLGEGWHNNHHYYQSCARQGFYWWEIDITYYLLQGLAALHLIWDLREPPARVLNQPLTPGLGKRASAGENVA